MDILCDDLQNIIYDFKYKSEFRDAMKELVYTSWIKKIYRVNNDFEPNNANINENGESDLYGDEVISILRRKFITSDNQSLDIKEYAKTCGKKEDISFEKLCKDSTFVNYNIPAGFPANIFLQIECDDDFECLLCLEGE